MGEAPNPARTAQVRSARSFSGKVAVLVALAALLPVAVLVGVAVGSVHLPLAQVARVAWEALTNQQRWQGLQSLNPTELIIQDIRLPRVLAGTMVGMALASAGTVYQALFRNPMAEPYVMGVSAGAALGATIGFILRVPVAIHLGLPAVPILAFLGAVGTTMLVYRLARGRQRRGTESLLLAGITVSTLVSAVISLLMLLNRQQIGSIMFWIMGGLAGRGWPDVQESWPYIALGLVILFWCANELNLLLLGDEKAQQLGIDPGRLEFLLVLGATLVTAAAVAISGLIAFVGLIVPHMVRLTVGPDHRFLLPGAALAGASFVVLADTLARSLLAPMEIPVGVVTALLGGPFFLYLLSRTREG